MSTPAPASFVQGAAMPPMPTGDAAAARRWLAGFLDAVGARGIRHSGRTLADHLLGTFDLLDAWGCRLDACVAGGLHSIHGTNAFAAQCIADSEREAVAALVGADAGRLVELFHRIDRPRAILEGLAGGHLVDRFSGEIVPARRGELEELLAIECANLVEQGADGGMLRGLSRLAPEMLDAILPPGVVRGLRANGRVGPCAEARPAADRRHRPRPGGAAA
jgi:hypothetical protein